MLKGDIPPAGVNQFVSPLNMISMGHLSIINGSMKIIRLIAIKYGSNRRVSPLLTVATKDGKIATANGFRFVDSESIRAERLVSEIIVSE